MKFDLFYIQTTYLIFCWIHALQLKKKNVSQFFMIVLLCKGDGKFYFHYLKSYIALLQKKRLLQFSFYKIQENKENKVIIFEKWQSKFRFESIFLHYYCMIFSITLHYFKIKIYAKFLNTFSLMMNVWVRIYSTFLYGENR